MGYIMWNINSLYIIHFRIPIPLNVWIIKNLHIYKGNYQSGTLYSFVYVNISIQYFPSAWKCSFCISLSKGLMMMDLCIFCMSKKPLFFKDIFTGYSIPDCFFFQFLKTLLHLTLACIVYYNEPAFIFTMTSLCIESLSLATFKISSL